MSIHKHPWRSSAVIVDNGKVLVIHRVKEGREYCILPGGSMEDGESGEETLVRELKEEASIDVGIIKKLGEVYNEFDGRTHRLFLCRIIGGTVRLGGEELGRHTERNQYILEWRPVAELRTIKFYPEGGRVLIEPVA